MFRCKRTAIRFDERLLGEVKKIAAKSGRTRTAVLEDALREMLAWRRAGRGSKPVRLKTVKGGGVQPGVDLDDSTALLDLMDS